MSVGEIAILIECECDRDMGIAGQERMQADGLLLNNMDAYLKTCTSRLGGLLLGLVLGVGSAAFASLSSRVGHAERGNGWWVIAYERMSGWAVAGGGRERTQMTISGPRDKDGGLQSRS